MDRTLLVRAAVLYLPLVTAWLIWLLRQPPGRQAGAVLIASLWNLFALLILHHLSVLFGWWGYGAEGGLLLGFPVDLYIAWILLWGTLPMLALPRAPLVLVVSLAFAVDVYLMPWTQPVVVLGTSWLTGEFVGLLIALLPAQLLGRWIAEDRHLTARVGLLAVGFMTLTLWWLPSVIFALTDQGWGSFLARSFWLNALALQLLLIPGLVGASAVLEFLRRGQGTPLPFDPPRRMVTSGIYAYLANPMQVSIALVLVAWGAVLGSAWLSLAGVMAVIFGSGFAAWSEGQQLEERFGQEWQDYRSHVHAWWPRWRPWAAIADEAQRPTIYIAEGCGPCSQIGGWVVSQQPIGLIVKAAEEHPQRDLTRVTYQPADGSGEEEGVAALGRAFEHLNLAWALLGMFIRLPVVSPLLQVLVDASGGGPQVVRRFRIE